MKGCELRRVDQDALSDVSVDRHAVDGSGDARVDSDPAARYSDSDGCHMVIDVALDLDGCRVPDLRCAADGCFHYTGVHDNHD